MQTGFMPSNRVPTGSNKQPVGTHSNDKTLLFRNRDRDIAILDDAVVIAL